MAKLSMYTNDHDWVIAESEEDARKVYEETIGEHYPEEYEPFEAMPDSHMFTLSDEDAEPNTVRKTAAEWVASNGRGYLGSSEW